jgi:hypothetical protein
MNYQTIYDGIKILEMNKSSLINTFGIYLKSELKKDNIGNKDNLLFDKFQDFYKSSLTKIINQEDKDMFLKNIVTLLNVLSHIATKININEADLNIIYKLMGNLKKLQFKIQTGTNNFTFSKNDDKVKQFKNQEIKKVEANHNTYYSSASPLSETKIDFTKIYKQKLQSEEKKQNSKKFKIKKAKMLNNIDKLMVSKTKSKRKGNSSSSSDTN